MTRKSDRAKSLRMLTPADAKALEKIGGMVDESIPPAAASALRDIEEIDEAQFAAFLGPRLGLYRDCVEDPASRLPVADELRLAQGTDDLIAELRRRLVLLPESIEIHADAASWKLRAEPFLRARQRLDAELNWTSAVLALAIAEHAKFQGRPGDKPAWARDALVRDMILGIAQRVPKRTKKARIAEIAHEVLKACALPVPADLAEFQKLERKVRKTGKD